MHRRDLPGAISSVKAKFQHRPCSGPPASQGSQVTRGTPSRGVPHRRWCGSLGERGPGQAHPLEGIPQPAPRAGRGRASFPGGRRVCSRGGRRGGLSLQAHSRCGAGETPGPRSPLPSQEGETVNVPVLVPQGGSRKDPVGHRRRTLPAQAAEARGPWLHPEPAGPRRPAPRRPRRLSLSHPTLH